MADEPTEEQLENVRKTLFGTNKAWVPRWLFDDLVNSSPVPPTPPTPTGERYIITFSLEQETECIVIPEDGSGSLQWTPSRIIIDAVEQETIKSIYTIGSGSHTIEIYDDSNNPRYNKVEYFDSDFKNNFQSIILPNHIIEIGREDFLNCVNLTSITIPPNVSHIGVYAFRGCTGLISIDTHAISIGSGAFLGCTNLTSVNISRNAAPFGDRAFQGCSSLISITLPNNDNATSINSGLFNGCSSLTTIDIPNCVISIGESAFRSCSGLTSIIIPDSVTSIGESAFRGCSGLTNITVLNTVPPQIQQGTNVFNNTNNCPIYVPTDSVETYKTTDGWSEYADRIQAIPVE